MSFGLQRVAEREGEGRERERKRKRKERVGRRKIFMMLNCGMDWLVVFIDIDWIRSVSLSFLFFCVQMLSLFLKILEGYLISTHRSCLFCKVKSSRQRRPWPRQVEKLREPLIFYFYIY